jgi:cell wall-associated NlpC family hydrolase
MKKYLACFFFVSSLLFWPPESSQANIIPKETKIVQGHAARLNNFSRLTLSPKQGKAKAVARTAQHDGFKGSRRGHKKMRYVKKRKDHASGQTPSFFTNVQSLDGLRQYYQSWRGTRYRSGGTSHAGVDCSGFTTLTFRDLYGVKLPRTAREQAMQGTPVSRGSLQPGDLVFFKRRHGDHVGIYLGDGNFMHASSSQGVTISSIDNVYWRDKFWKGSRLHLF